MADKQPSLLQVAWEVKAHLRRLLHPGEGYIPLSPAGPLVDARIALWVKDPAMPGIADAEDMLNKSERVGFLVAGNVPFGSWVRFFLKLEILWILMGSLIMVALHVIGMGPF